MNIQNIQSKLKDEILEELGFLSDIKAHELRILESKRKACCQNVSITSLLNIQYVS